MQTEIEGLSADVPNVSQGLDVSQYTCIDNNCDIKKKEILILCKNCTYDNNVVPLTVVDKIVSEDIEP